MQPRPAPGIQFVVIPEFAGLGTEASQQISSAIAGRTTVKAALDAGQDDHRADHGRGPGPRDPHRQRGAPPGAAAARGCRPRPAGLGGGPAVLPAGRLDGAHLAAHRGGRGHQPAVPGRTAHTRGLPQLLRRRHRRDALAAADQPPSSSRSLCSPPASRRSTSWCRASRSAPSTDRCPARPHARVGPARPRRGAGRGAGGAPAPARRSSGSAPSAWEVRRPLLRPRAHRPVRRRPPLVLGHEAGRVVVALGPDVDGRRLQVGMRVSLEPGVPCRCCEQCPARYNLCPRIAFATAVRRRVRRARRALRGVRPPGA